MVITNRRVWVNGKAWGWDKEKNGRRMLRRKRRGKAKNRKRKKRRDRLEGRK